MKETATRHCSAIRNRSDMRSLIAIIILVLVFPVISFGDTGVSSNPLDEGLKLFNQGKYKDALPKLSLAVNQKLNDPVYRLTYGIVLATNRQYQDAANQFQEVTKLVPDDPTAYLLLQGAYTQLGRIVEARSAASAAEIRMRSGIKSPGPVGVGSVTGVEADVIGRLDLSQKILRHLADHPENSIMQNLMGDICQVQGRLGEAIGYYKSATNLAPGWVKPWFNLGMANRIVNPAEAIANFKKVIELDPNNMQAQLWLGDVYESQNQFPLALQAYQNAMNDRMLESQARSRAGNIYLKQNDPVKAEEEFRKAAQQAPDDPVPAAGLGEALHQQMKLDESAKNYQKASDLTRTAPVMNSQVVPNLANVYAAKGDYRKAIEELKRAVSMNPAYYDPVRMLVDTYRQSGNLGQGISEYEAALKQNPHDVVAMQFLVCAYAYTGNHEGRARMAEKLIKELPQNRALWYRELGLSRVYLGDNKGAMEAWRNGLEVDPLLDSAQIIEAVRRVGMLQELTEWYKKESETKKVAAPSLILADIYESNRDYKLAAEVRKRLVELYPDTQHYWILLGDDLAAAGDQIGAKTAYKKAAEMPDIVMRSIAQQRLNSLR